MNTQIKTFRPVVALAIASAFGSAFALQAQADVKYTSVSSYARDGKMSPMSTSITWRKDGLQRIDTKQDMGTYKSEETVVMNAPKRQQMTYNAATKMYYIEPLGGTSSGGSNGGSGGTKAVSAVKSTPKTGAVVMTYGAKYLGVEKLMARPARHYILNTAVDTSGCAGNNKSKTKQEIWMADVTLPTFDYPGMNDGWKSIYNGGKDDCKPTFTQKGDVQAYQNAYKGLALKTIMFGEDGKPVMQTEITMLSFAKLAANPFAIPAGFKKVTKDEYYKARTEQMTSAYASKFSEMDGEDAPKSSHVKNTAAPVENDDDASAVVEVAAPAATPQTSTRYAPVALKNDAKLDKNLLEAVQELKVEEAIGLLQNGANPNAADKGGTTALMFAAQGGKADLVSALLDMGANSNAVNKKGQTALHLATTIGAPKAKKKKFGGLGGLLGSAVAGNILGGSGLGNLGNFGSLLGGGGIESLLGNNLQGLLNGGTFNLSGKSGWMAIIGTALQGDIKSNGAYGLKSLLNGKLDSMGASQWINLVGAVKGSNADVLNAMSNIAGGHNAQWGQFMSAAASGDVKSVTSLMNDSKMKPLLDQALQGFSAASGELPANAARSIVSTLLQKGATASLADGEGKTAAQLFQAREWNDVAALLTK